MTKIADFTKESIFKEFENFLDKLKTGNLENPYFFKMNDEILNYQIGEIFETYNKGYYVLCKTKTFYHMNNSETIFKSYLIPDENIIFQKTWIIEFLITPHKTCFSITYLHLHIYPNQNSKSIYINSEGSRHILPPLEIIPPQFCNN